MDFYTRFQQLQRQRDTSDELIKVCAVRVHIPAIFSSYPTYNGSYLAFSAVTFFPNLFFFSPCFRPGFRLIGMAADFWGGLRLLHNDRTY